ncbi:MAG TPA: BadF/BadG/BcrA/BcrD ATPase family protein [Gemmatimonadales bacterium]|nr:BadF/BadG/BcrA/BcrD ATPase family protein [Gemmatimonadales bacterium]
MIVLGADLGGTSSRVALFVHDVEHGRHEGPGGPMRSGRGVDLARDLAALARPLLTREGAVRADVLVVGASGAGREQERSELQQALEAERLAWKVVVTTDAELARAAAFDGGPGVLLIAGTGSIALARDAAGREHRVGGLGWRMGDQGSAYWLGHMALAAVGRMHDHLGPVTHLAEALCTAAGVPGVAGLVRWSTTATPADVARLGPHVVSCADRGDAVAAEIVRDAVAWLVRLVEAAGGGALPVALSGGLLAPERPLRARVEAALGAHGIGPIRAAPIDPCRGALTLAR